MESVITKQINSEKKAWVNPEIKIIEISSGASKSFVESTTYRVS